MWVPASKLEQCYGDSATSAQLLCKPHFGVYRHQIKHLKQLRQWKIYNRPNNIYFPEADLEECYIASQEEDTTALSISLSVAYIPHLLFPDGLCVARLGVLGTSRSSSRWSSLHPSLLRMALTSDQGRPSPLRPWCIPPVSDFPPIFENFLDFLENFTNFTFSRKNFPFSSAKISDDFFLVVDHKFWIFPYFACFRTFPAPWFAKIYYFPSTFQNFLPCFLKIQQLFTYFTCNFPLLWPWCIYASPNARTGRPCVGR